MSSDVKNMISQVVGDDVLSRHYTFYDGFVFQPLTFPGNIYDAIVISNPYDCRCTPGGTIRSEKTLEEHIEYINKNNLEKAIIKAVNINFITQCPSLKYIKIIPADDAPKDFDFSPLYEMPEIKMLTCCMEYGSGLQKRVSSNIDYLNVKGLLNLNVSEKGHLNYDKVDSLKSLGVSGFKGKNRDITDLFCSSELDSLSIIQCGIKSLNGIEISKNMQCLYLYYNRLLQDISALRKVRKTLRALRIENCPKIEDFSVLIELENLELLELSGNNSLVNLDFLKSMKNLKTFTFSMNVVDGNLYPCLNLSYVYSEKNRRHYNLKDADLPKGKYVRGNEGIEFWRRLE